METRDPRHGRFRIRKLEVIVPLYHARRTPEVDQPTTGERTRDVTTGRASACGAVDDSDDTFE